MDTKGNPYNPVLESKKAVNSPQSKFDKHSNPFISPLHLLQILLTCFQNNNTVSKDAKNICNYSFRPGYLMASDL